jgi:hypothetical protein
MPDDVGDISELLHLFEQIDADVASMTADGGTMVISPMMLSPNVTQRGGHSLPQTTAVTGERHWRSAISISRPLYSMDALSGSEAWAIIAGVLR